MYHILSQYRKYVRAGRRAALVCAVVCAFLAAGLPTPCLAAPQGGSAAKTALPVSRRISVDGETASLNGFVIDNYTYFKLRDMSALLDGTLCGFGVSYDAVDGVIVLTSSDSSRSRAPELAKSPAVSDKKAVAYPSELNTTLDGKPIELSAYTIENYSYVKIRDLSDMLGITIDYDQPSDTILIAIPAKEPVPTPHPFDHGATNGTLTFISLTDGILRLYVEKPVKIARIELVNQAGDIVECVKFDAQGSPAQTLFDKNNVISGYMFAVGELEATFDMPTAFVPQRILVFEEFNGKPLIFDMDMKSWVK